MYSTRTSHILSLLLTISIAAPAVAEYYPPPDSKGGWRSLTNADDRKLRKVAGMNRAKLEEAFQYAKETTQHGGIVVVRHGWLVYEKYFGKGNRLANPDMASCGKAFTSIACGIMLNEKREQFPNGLEEKVFTQKYLPEAFPLDDPAKADIKLGQLLAMSSGFHGESTQPGYKHGEKIPLEPYKIDRSLGMDLSALRTPLWCKPGDGYSYSSPAPHVASIVLRNITGMELQEYIDQKLAKPMQWGRWNYCMYRNGATLAHTPGAGSIALWATDTLRFAYLLLHQGRWQNRQLVPAEYVALCSRPSPYNAHYPYSLQFEVNQDGHVAGAPRDAFWKSGAGGFSIYVVPSLDMVLYKLGGNDKQYDATLTGLPDLYTYDGSRDNWKPSTATGGGVNHLLELVSAAVVDGAK
jgi:CubicO group peptidase (beta-lactamase class C family)